MSLKIAVGLYFFSFYALSTVSFSPRSVPGVTILEILPIRTTGTSPAARDSAEPLFERFIFRF